MCRQLSRSHTDADCLMQAHEKGILENGMSPVNVGGLLVGHTSLPNRKAR